MMFNILKVKDDYKILSYALAEKEKWLEPKDKDVSDLICLTKDQFDDIKGDVDFSQYKEVKY